MPGQTIYPDNIFRYSATSEKLVYVPLAQVL